MERIENDSCTKKLDSSLPFDRAYVVFLGILRIYSGIPGYRRPRKCGCPPVSGGYILRKLLALQKANGWMENFPDFKAAKPIYFHGYLFIQRADAWRLDWLPL